MVQLKELWLAGRSSGAGDKKTIKAAGEAVIKVERRIFRVLCVHRHIVSVFLLSEKGLGLDFKINSGARPLFHLKNKPTQLENLPLIFRD